MRVLQILSCTGFHGAEAMTAELSRQLHGLGVEVDLAVLDNGGRGNDEIFSVVGSSASATHRIPCDRQFDLKTVTVLKQLVADRRIEIVHSHSYKTTFYAGLLRPWSNFGLISTYHNWLLHTPALRFYAALDKRLARLNDFGVGVSTPVFQELQRHMRKSRVLQIDNGIDVTRYLPSCDKVSAKLQLGVNPTRSLIGFVGRLSPEKGLGYLLQALAHEDLMHVDLVIAGDGPERQLIEGLIAEMGLEPRVKLLGYRRDTESIYHALDAFVLPSTLEAFPMVLLEAMSCGVPVVASSVGEIPRIITPTETGWLAGPAHVEELRWAIRQAIYSPDSPTIGEAAREKVIREFSSAAMAQRYLRLYEKAQRRSS